MKDQTQDTWLKVESLQRTGSFKLRGATNALARLHEDERQQGVVTHSSGNHGQAVACAAAALGIPATVVMPEAASPFKMALTRRWGAQIVLRPAHHTVDHAKELARQSRATLIPPFDDPAIVAGQGTVAVELLEQVPEPSTVLVPVGGGGLLAGMATALKLLQPETRVVAVEPELAGDLNEGFHDGRRRSWPTSLTSRTVADGLRAGSVGALPWIQIERHVDDVLTVTEHGIRSAMTDLAETGKLVVEPSGAVATAALLEHPNQIQHPAAAVVTGGNIALDAFTRLLDDVRGRDR